MCAATLFDVWCTEALGLGFDLSREVARACADAPTHGAARQSATSPLRGGAAPKQLDTRSDVIEAKGPSKKGFNFIGRSP
jgi:hypothetical protein